MKRGMSRDQYHALGVAIETGAALTHHAQRRIVQREQFENMSGDSIMYGQWKKKVPKKDWVEAHVPPTQATPEQVETYNALLRLYRLGTIGTGIRAFALSRLRFMGDVVGLWGISGHKHWEDFCVKVLGISRRGADNIVLDGLTVCRVLDLQPQFDLLLKSPESGKDAPILKLMENLSLEAGPKSVNHEYSKAILDDSRISRAVYKVPTEQLDEVFEKSRGDDGKISAKAVRATVKALMPDKPPEVMATTAPARKDLDYEALRDQLHDIGQSLIEMSNAQPSYWSAATLNGWVQQLRLAARKLR